MTTSFGDTPIGIGEECTFDAVEPKQTSCRGLPDRRLEWMAAVAAGDADAYAGLVTEAVVWVPPGGGAIVGRPALVAWVQPFFREFTYEFEVRPVDVVVLEDWAIERGSFVSGLSSRGAGARIDHSGNYVLVWARSEDHVWRIDRYFDVTASVLG